MGAGDHAVGRERRVDEAEKLKPKSEGSSQLAEVGRS